MQLRVEVLPKSAVESIHTEKRQEDLTPWIAIIAEPSVLCGLENDKTYLKSSSIHCGRESDPLAGGEQKGKYDDLKGEVLQGDLWNFFLF